MFSKNYTGETSLQMKQLQKFINFEVCLGYMFGIGKVFVNRQYTAKAKIQRQPTQLLLYHGVFVVSFIDISRSK